MYINTCKSDFSGDNEGFFSLSTTGTFEQIIFLLCVFGGNIEGMKKYFIYCRMFSNAPWPLPTECQ